MNIQGIGSMTLAQAKEYCIKKRENKGIPCEGRTCELFKSNLCGTSVILWNLDSPRLTPEELDICRALCAKYVARNLNELGVPTVNLWNGKPMRDQNGFFGEPQICVIATILADKFPSIKPGDCISVEDLL